MLRAISETVAADKSRAKKVGHLRYAGSLPAQAPLSDERGYIHCHKSYDVKVISSITILQALGRTETNK